jgi:hypothetical protein
MKYTALCLWVIVPLGLWFAASYWGTPHVALTYRFYDNGDGYDPRAHRTYIDCTYYGWAGAITRPAEDGRCPWVRVFPSDAS